MTDHAAWRHGRSALLALVMLAWAATAQAALDPFSATYDITHGRKRIGNSTQELRLDEGVAVYEAVTQPRGLARLLSGVVTDRSEFELMPDWVRPLVFTSTDARKEERNVRVEFDWTSGRARTVYEGETREHPLPANAIDRNVLPLALMCAMSAGAAPTELTVIDRHRVRQYRIEALGEEKMETPAGAFRTMKLRQFREESSREVLLWLAPELGFLPVKILQLKDGEAKLGMTLRETTLAR